MFASQLYDRHHFGGRLRKHDHVRARFIDATVVFVDCEIFGLVEKSAGAKEFFYLFMEGRRQAKGYRESA